MRWRWLLFHPQLSQKSQIQFHQIPYGQQKPIDKNPLQSFLSSEKMRKKFQLWPYASKALRSPNSAFYQTLHYGTIVERNLWSQNPKRILAFNLKDFERLFLWKLRCHHWRAIIADQKIKKRSRHKMASKMTLA